MQRPAQTFKECWDALPPLRPVPGRTRSLQLPVYRRWPLHVEAVTKVKPYMIHQHLHVVCIQQQARVRDILKS